MAVQLLVLAGLLALILGLLSESLQSRLANWLRGRPLRLLAAPVGLTATFAMAAALAHAWSVGLIALVLAYTLLPSLCALAQGPGPVPPPASMLPPALPSLCALAQGPGPVKRPTWGDLATILLLWLPLEFAGGAAALIPRPAQGLLHGVAYGIAILLALVIFVGLRGLDGMKYKLPAGAGDFGYAIAGFLLSAPVLIALGIWLGFIPAPHAPRFGPGRLAQVFLLIAAGTALPEEILFRSLIQNWWMERYGSTTKMLLVAAFIFGCAHLDNGPQPLPNWRYMILATIAGVAYGKVFQKSSSVWGSVTLHALVDFTKHAFF